jgi:hypothetical protein
MKRTCHHRLLAAAVMLLAGTAVAQAEPLSRAEVKSELAEWRAQGMLDRNGEAGATSEVLAARERFNQEQTQTLVAQSLQRQREANRLALAAMPDEIATYREAGPDGPQIVVVRIGADGSVYEIDSIDVASID